MSFSQKEFLDIKFETEVDVYEAALFNFNFEEFDIPDGFKRIYFILSKDNSFKVNKPDFYGNVSLEVPHPKRLSYYCLRIIWGLSETNNRYNVILSLLSLLKESKNETQFIKNAHLFYLNCIDNK
jgi:hypothetical protein